MLNKETLPQHVAIIMDGNGRWAKLKGKTRAFGHQNGVESIRSIVDLSVQLGIQYLTLYAFSTENWKRPKTEINVLLSLISKAIQKEFEILNKNSIQLKIIGILEDFPQGIQRELISAMEKTKNNTGMILSVALSYGSREEILQATRAISRNVVEGILDIDSIHEETLQGHLYTNLLPDVDLLIRTSGEYRLSNFLLWQSAYAELYFTDVLWPDFRENEFLKALLEYQNRERRFGKTSEQLIQN